MPIMITDNWLLSYASVKGISTTLNNMTKRRAQSSNMNFAVLDLEKYYGEFESEFTVYFEELRIFCENKLKEL